MDKEQFVNPFGMKDNIVRGDGLSSFWPATMIIHDNLVIQVIINPLLNSVYESIYFF